MADDENFANYPRSIADIKSDRSGNSLDWKPRDALIDMLRDIDSGQQNPQTLIIVYKTLKEDGHYKLGYVSAGVPSVHEGVGILAETIHRRLDV